MRKTHCILLDYLTKGYLILNTQYEPAAGLCRQVTPLTGTGRSNSGRVKPRRDEQITKQYERLHRTENTGVGVLGCVSAERYDQAWC